MEGRRVEREGEGTEAMEVRGRDREVESVRVEARKEVRRTVGGTGVEVDRVVVDARGSCRIASGSSSTSEGQTRNMGMVLTSEGLSTRKGNLIILTLRLHVRSRLRLLVRRPREFDRREHLCDRTERRSLLQCCVVLGCSHTVERILENSRCFRCRWRSSLLR
jgi:hypothetical protein